MTLTSSQTVVWLLTPSLSSYSSIQLFLSFHMIHLVLLSHSPSSSLSCHFATNNLPPRPTAQLSFLHHFLLHHPHLDSTKFFIFYIIHLLLRPHFLSWSLSCHFHVKIYLPVPTHSRSFLTLPCSSPFSHHPTDISFPSRHTHVHTFLFLSFPFSALFAPSHGHHPVSLHLYTSYPIIPLFVTPFSMPPHSRKFLTHLFPSITFLALSNYHLSPVSPHSRNLDLPEQSTWASKSHFSTWGLMSLKAMPSGHSFSVSTLSAHW